MDDIKIPQAEEFFHSMNTEDTTPNIKIEFLGRVVTIIIAGLGLITALAWDEVLKDIYTYFLESLTGINEKLGYALFVTLFSVIISNTFTGKKCFCNVPV